MICNYISKLNKNKLLIYLFRSCKPRYKCNQAFTSYIMSLFYETVLYDTLPKDPRKSCTETKLCADDVMHFTVHVIKEKGS